MFIFVYCLVVFLFIRIGYELLIKPFIPIVKKLVKQFWQSDNTNFDIEEKNETLAANKINLNDKMDLPGITPLNPAQFINDYLRKEQLLFKISEEGKCFTILFDLKESDPGELFILVYESDSRIIFKNIIYRDFPDASMLRLTEFVTRFNEKLVHGKFNIHHDERILTYDLTVFLYNLQLTDELVDFYFQLSYYGLETHKALAKRVIEKNEEPILIAIEYFMNQENSKSHSSSGSK